MSENSYKPGAYATFQEAFEGGREHERAKWEQDTSAQDEDRDGPLTRERIEQMSEEEINARWPEVSKVMEGEGR